MSQSADRLDVEKFVKLFCIKSTQIIVQGRIGKPVSTPCTPHTGSEWKMVSINLLHNSQLIDLHFETKSFETPDVLFKD